MDFLKIPIIRFLSLVIAFILFIESSVYGTDMCDAAQLRVPIQTKQINTRLKQVVVVVIDTRKRFENWLQTNTSGQKTLSKKNTTESGFKQFKAPKSVIKYTNPVYMRWINWWFNPLFASTGGSILIGLIWAFLLPNFSPFIAQWLSVGFTSWALDVLYGNKRAYSPAIILLSLGTGALGPLLGIPHLSGYVLTVLINVAIIAAGFRVYMDLNNAKVIKELLPDKELILKNKRFSRITLTFTIVSIFLISFAHYGYYRYDYFSLRKNFDNDHSAYMWAPPKTHIATIPDDFKKFSWFAYMKDLELHHKDTEPYFIFENANRSPEKFAKELLYLQSLKAADRHIIPMNAIDHIRIIRCLPPDYIKWITEAANKHNRAPELYVDAMMAVATADYSIGHGINIIYRRKVNPDHITFTGLQRHWPTWFYFFDPGEKITDIFSGVVFPLKASMGIYQIRPAMVRRYLKTFEGKDVSSLSDRTISLALLNPRTNIEVFAEIQEGVIEQVDSIREKTLQGTPPDIVDFYRESRHETIKYGAMTPTIENYSLVPSRATLGEHDWILWEYHPLYYLKFWPKPYHMALVVLSGILDNKPALFDVSDGDASLKQLIVLRNDPDPYIRNAAKSTIRDILIGYDMNAKFKMFELIEKKDKFFFLNYISLSELRHIIDRPIVQQTLPELKGIASADKNRVNL